MDDLYTNETYNFAKTYGELDDPEFTFTTTPALPFDDATDPNLFQGALGREGEQNAGIYDITIGDLDAGGNYIINSVLVGDPKFKINPATLYVSAISPSLPIFAGDPLSSADIQFTFGYCDDSEDPSYGFRNDEDESIFFSGIDVMTNPPYDGSANVYEIIFNSTADNYIIEQVQKGDEKDVLGCYNDPGLLYVNPWDDLHVHPRLDCIEENPYYEVEDDPRASYPYVAHLYYDNPYSITVFLPIEERNIFYYASGSGTFIADKQPEYFIPGQDVGLFDVYFDGNRLIWALTSGSSTKTAAISSDASTGSARCQQTGARLAFSNEERTTSTFDLEEINGYPNPVSDTYFIHLNEELVSSVKVSLVDIQGKLYDVRMTRNSSMRRLELDLVGLNKGLYLLKLDFESDYKILKIIKQ